LFDEICLPVNGIMLKHNDYDATTGLLLLVFKNAEVLLTLLDETKTMRLWFSFYFDFLSHI